MATLSIKSSKHGGKSVSYTKDVKSHSEEFERCLSLSGVNCNPENARAEFSKVWERFRVKTGEDIQTYNLIQAFSNEEFDPDNPEDVLKVNDIGHALAEKLYPDRQVVVATQADNKGRNLHNHIVVNNVSEIDGTRLSGERIRWINLSKEHDELLKEKGAHVIERENSKAFDKQTIKEIKLRDSGKYVWKDDLKTRIEKCLEDETIKNTTDFKQKMMDDYDVDVRVRKNGNISYYFKDQEEKQRKIRAGKLGLKYGKDGVEYAIATNAERIEPVKTQELSRLNRDIPVVGSPEPSHNLPEPKGGRTATGYELSYAVSYHHERKITRKKGLDRNDNPEPKENIRNADSRHPDAFLTPELIQRVANDINQSSKRQRELRSRRSTKKREQRTGEFDQPEI